MPIMAPNVRCQPAESHVCDAPTRRCPHCVQGSDSVGRTRVPAWVSCLAGSSEEDASERGTGRGCGYIENVLGCMCAPLRVMLEKLKRGCQMALGTANSLVFV